MRSTEEWIGKNDDQAIPERVRLRIFERDGRRCYLCALEIRVSDGLDFHHHPPLADGGEHRESRIYSVHRKCHRLVTATEAMARAETRQTVKKHYGIVKPKGRPLAGTKASGLRKRMNGTVEVR